MTKKVIEFGGADFQLRTIYDLAQQKIDGQGLARGSVVEDRYGKRWRLANEPNLAMCEPCHYGAPHAHFSVYAKCQRWLKSNRWSVRTTFRNLTGYAVIEDTGASQTQEGSCPKDPNLASSSSP